MSRVLITGSADGLGQMAAQLLVEAGHQVLLHPRSEQRAAEAAEAVSEALGVLVCDLSSIAQTRAVAEQANAAGPLDAVIHNAGVGYREHLHTTADGLEHVFAINVLAPYLLTALIAPPRRLVYLSSGMHRGGDPDLSDLQWQRRPWNGSQAYSDSNLLDVVLAFALPRRRPGTLSNALEPGWVPTKMGGARAPDDLAQGAQTQVWLAASDDPQATVTDGYFYHRQPREALAAASGIELQEGLLAACREISGVALPE